MPSPWARCESLLGNRCRGHAHSKCSIKSYFSPLSCLDFLHSKPSHLPAAAAHPGADPRSPEHGRVPSLSVPWAPGHQHASCSGLLGSGPGGPRRAFILQREPRAGSGPSLCSRNSALGAWLLLLYGAPHPCPLPEGSLRRGLSVLSSGSSLEEGA